MSQRIEHVLGCLLALTLLAAPVGCTKPKEVAEKEPPPPPPPPAPAIPFSSPPSTPPPASETSGPPAKPAAPTAQPSSGPPRNPSQAAPESSASSPPSNSQSGSDSKANSSQSNDAQPVPSQAPNSQNSNSSDAASQPGADADKSGASGDRGTDSNSATETNRRGAGTKDSMGDAGTASSSSPAPAPTANVDWKQRIRDAAEAYEKAESAARWGRSEKALEQALQAMKGLPPRSLDLSDQASGVGDAKIAAAVKELRAKIEKTLESLDEAGVGKGEKGRMPKNLTIR